MTLALIILALGLTSVVWLVGHARHDHRSHHVTGTHAITVARRPRRRPF